MDTHFQILIVGGGNAGISVAAQLLRKDPNLTLAIVEPSDKHYYQPAWTLVGGGEFALEDTIRTEAEVMPERAVWIRDRAVAFVPDQNQVETATSGILTYDYLVVCPGIQLNWGQIKGLPETLGKNGVCSNYAVDQCSYTWETVRNFKGGTALFTSPGTPVKCGGAPQKVMYLSSDHFKRRGILKQTRVEFCTAGGMLFGVKKYAAALEKVVARYGIHLFFRHDLISIDGPQKKVVFKVTDRQGHTTEVTKSFDMIHVTPPQSAPDFVRESPLADAAGWIDVDPHTLRHRHYDNVFGLGDATNTPNAKTGAAVRKQAPVVVENLLAALQHRSLPATYNGYGSCPLVTGIGRLILAEFDYNHEPQESFPFDQARERFSMYQLKKRVLPWMYWNKILKGTA
ncbi:sulfide:quinone oxidoreductase [Catalinimonas alkaloidigena]|uniref:Sulfide:quinone oxidoreductase n=1 Tax=Catalinimonas alkaloidigena TaxID=1075417 RepID=A0A1G9P007_9BACT|nr:FAD/NAD(P)-binding oxidoreductase [Catalinimonas alkaloidigena]SDL91990.1 sulfide:quinone oxidoreductase [Catalinimonas alkaloidigena]